MKKETVDIRIGQEIKLAAANFRVALVSVDEDSRCPQGVQCIWAGNAKLLLKLSADASKSERRHLNTMREPRSLTFHSWKIEISKVMPPRIVGQRINPKDYVVTLTLTEESTQGSEVEVSES